MARDFNRSDRVADAVQRSLAQMIPSEIHDPRLGIVNINAVDVTRDLAHAKIFVTFVGQEDSSACEESVDILNNAANYLRNLMGKEMTIRTVPRLRFIFDESAVRGQALSSLIDRAIAADKSKQRED